MKDFTKSEEKFEHFCERIANGEEELDITKYSDIERIITTAHNLLDATFYGNRSANIEDLNAALIIRLNSEFEKLPPKEKPKNFAGALKEKLSIQKDTTANDIREYIIESLDIKFQETHGIKTEKVSNYLQIKRGFNCIYIVCPDNDKCAIALPNTRGFAECSSDLFNIKAEPINDSVYNITISSIKEFSTSVEKIPLEKLIVNIYPQDTSFCVIHKKESDEFERINFDDLLRVKKLKLESKYHIKKEKKTRNKTSAEVKEVLDETTDEHNL